MNKTFRQLCTDEKYYHIYGTPLLSDPTKTFILRPKTKSLKWYKRFWYKLYSAFRAVYQGLKP